MMDGLCIDYAWIMHGLCMEYAWVMQGLGMDLGYGSYMDLVD